MPTVKTIDNIKIDIYSRDHPPPHVHAKFAEFEELIDIETLETYAGKRPKAQRKKSNRLGGKQPKIPFGDFQ